MVILWTPSDFAKDKYFNGYSDNRLVLENFDLITSSIQESAEKHIPSKISRSTSSVPWITPEIKRKIRRRNRTHAKAKKTGSNKLRAKLESLRRDIKVDVKKQYDSGIFLRWARAILRENNWRYIKSDLIFDWVPYISYSNLMLILL